MVALRQVAAYLKGAGLTLERECGDRGMAVPLIRKRPVRRASPASQVLTVASGGPSQDTVEEALNLGRLTLNEPAGARGPALLN